MATTQDLGQRLVNISGKYTEADDILSEYVRQSAEGKIQKTAASKDTGAGTTAVKTHVSRAASEAVAESTNAATKAAAENNLKVVGDSSAALAGALSESTTAVTAPASGVGWAASGRATSVDSSVTTAIRMGIEASVLVGQVQPGRARRSAADRLIRVPRWASRAF